MPMELRVHSPECAWRSTGCACTPQEFTEPKKATAAHGGNHNRLEVRITPPVAQYVPEVPYHRSQARRHRAAISY